ncbi:MAG: hypothetical protein K0S76_658 [Herbinix sp.]|jgi:hypothetical protein|nr:hypothetical protein [Herbinix sp.]
MKKNIYLIVCLTVLTILFTGCGAKDQMVSFIPTPTPAPTDEDGNEITDDTSDEDASEDSDSAEEDSDEPIVVGNTTTMYVKLSQYGAVLNIRSEPSTNGKVVGSLVHTEKVEVVKIEDGWACFVKNNKYVYVKADYLVEKRPAYIDPPTFTPTPSPLPTDPAVNPEI